MTDNDAAWVEFDSWLAQQFDPVSALLEVEAEGRTQAHGDRAWGIVSDRDFLGLAGEKAFGQAYRQPIDWERKREGDKGIDFWLPLRFSVDVRCIRQNELRCGVGKVVADIYVLAEFKPRTRQAELIGWEYGSKLKDAPIKELPSGLNHCLSPPLRPMADLAARIMYLW